MPADCVIDSHAIMVKRKPRRQSAECIGKACNLGGRLCRKSRRNGLAFFSGFCYNQCSEKATKRNSSDRAHSERKRQVKTFCIIYREPVLELCTEEKKIHQGKFISQAAPGSPVTEKVQRAEITRITKYKNRGVQMLCVRVQEFS